MYLRRRGKWFHYRRRIPKKFRGIFPYSVVQVPLETDSEEEALRRAQGFNQVLEEHLMDLSVGGSDGEECQFKKAVHLARLAGFRYIPKSQLVEQGPLHEVINRVNAADAVDDQEMKQAILGGIKEPVITLRKALKSFLDFEEANLKGWSEDQKRIWRNPRKASIENFISVVGNKDLRDVARQDVLDFRTWWKEKMESEELSANTANKQFGFVRRILSSARDNHCLEIEIEQLFRKINIKEVHKETRQPFETRFIQEVLFDSDILKINEEARMFVFAMADTGCRINELVGLEDGDVVLNAEMPHIKIRPNSIRKLKTPQSKRDIPLVGASLFAFKSLGGPFERYRGKSNLISETINKFCRRNGIYPSSDHTLYSLRHSFEDRLTAVEPPEKVQAALMGHKYSRPRYGLGPSLEQKRSWLDRIAFHCGV